MKPLIVALITLLLVSCYTPVIYSNTLDLASNKSKLVIKPFSGSRTSMNEVDISIEESKVIQYILAKAKKRAIKYPRYLAVSPSPDLSILRIGGETFYVAEDLWIMHYNLNLNEKEILYNILSPKSEHFIKPKLQNKSQ